MAELSSIGQSLPTVQCSFLFLSDLDLYRTEKPYFYSGKLEPELEKSRTNLAYSERSGIHITDLRGSEHSLDLEHHGFCFLRHKSLADFNVIGDEMILSYIRETSEVVKQLFQAEKVVCYDYRYRRNVPCPANYTQGVGDWVTPDEPTRIPHVDHTLEGGPRRIQRHLTTSELAQYPQSHFRHRIINTWRPLFGPVQDSPLAFCDYRTVFEKDLFAADRVSSEYCGEVYYLQYSERQRWYYLSSQMPHELALFVSYDSSPHRVIAFCPHAAFNAPNVKESTEHRQSIETRMIVITKLNARNRTSDATE